MKRKSQFFIDPITNEIKITFFCYTKPFIEEMKSLGFRWDPIERTWHAKVNEKRLEFAQDVEFYKPGEGPNWHLIPKTPTWLVTLNLYNEGKTVTEIAQKRGVTEKTIYKHLTECAKSGQVDAYQVIPEDIISKIVAYKKAHPQITGLKEIYEYYNGTISYEEIKLVLACLKSL